MPPLLGFTQGLGKTAWNYHLRKLWLGPSVFLLWLLLTSFKGIPLSGGNSPGLGTLLKEVGRTGAFPSRKREQ